MSVGGIERFWRSFLYGSKHPLYLSLHNNSSNSQIPMTAAAAVDRKHHHTASRMRLGLLCLYHKQILTNNLQAIGGSVWHGIKGFRNSPYGERRIGALTAIKARAPVLGGNFGVWGGLFSTFDCAVKGIRKKEDPYNASTYRPFPPASIQQSGG